MLLRTMKNIITKEIEDATASGLNTLFREEDFSSPRIGAFLFVIGGQYLYDTLIDPVTYIRTSEIDTLEPDIFNVVSPGRERHNYHTAQRFVRRATRIIGAIVDSALNCPPIIRYVLAFIKNQIELSFPDADANSIVTGFIFLRFFVPAVAKPSDFTLLAETEDITGIGYDNEIQISPTLQARNLKRARIWALLARIV